MSSGREGRVLSSGGVWLHFHAWEASSPRRALAVVHGLGEHGGRYAAFGAWLAERGTSVWAIDVRGMGQSGGPRGQLGSWTEWLDDLRRLWTTVERESPGAEIVPFGHSVGGVVVASAVLRGVLRPRRFVLSNPAFRVRMPVPGWKRALGAVAERVTPRLTMPSGIDPRLLARDPAVGEAYVSDPWVHDRLSAGLYGEWMRAGREVVQHARDLRTPYLLLLSPEDPIIDPRASEEFERATAVGQVVRRYPDRWHEPLNDLGREEVFADVLAWLQSGARNGRMIAE
ncbi:MAG: lysophospholipase [Candidatus Dormibacteraeota bacterium]|nr:lysophospholipase [Candidatus Dormibacteraeota bacterium]